MVGWVEGGCGETRERGRGWGNGDQAPAPGLCRTSPPQEAAHSAHTCGLADRPPPRLPAAARRRLGCWGLDAALHGSGSIRPHPGAGHTSLTLRPPHPPGGGLCTSDETAPLGGGGHTWDRTLGRGAGKRSGWTSASSRLGLEGPGAPAPSPSPPSASLGGGQAAPKR